MVESALGRRRSLAVMTLFTALFCMLFVIVQSPLFIRISSVGISLSATVSEHFCEGFTDSRGG